MLLASQEKIVNLAISPTSRSWWRAAGGKAYLFDLANALPQGSEGLCRAAVLLEWNRGRGLCGGWREFCHGRDETCGSGRRAAANWCASSSGPAAPG